MSRALGVAQGLVKIASVMVPAAQRERWQREWEAELWHREQQLSDSGASIPRAWARLVVPALGAFVHSAFLRIQNPGFEPLVQDARFAVRSYRRSPGFTVAAVLTLALGIAANVAVLAVAKGALFSPYPYEDADRLAVISSRDVERPGAALPVAYPDLEEMRATGVLESVTAFDWDPFNLRLADRTQWVGGGVVSASAFETLGIQPLMGRGFRAGEDLPGAAPVVVLGEALWRSAFGAEDVVGTSIWLDGTAYEVIGVAPATMDIPEGAQLWVPLKPTGSAATRRSFWLQALGRVADGHTLEQAQAALVNLSQQLAGAYPDTHNGRSFVLTELREARTGGVRPAFLALLGAVGVLLLIVCANLMSLMLARSARRQDEFGVRQALGANHGRLARQLLMESVVLAGAGGVLGLLLGSWAVGATSRLIPDWPTWFQPAIDPAVVLFAIGLSVVSAIIFGIAPVLTGINRLRSAARGGRSAAKRTRDMLVFGEVAFSTVLLLAAGLLIKSLTQLTAVDPGFEVEQRISGTIQLPSSRYAEDADAIDLTNRLLANLEARPDVQSAAVVTRMPFRSGINSVMWWEDGQSGDAFRENPQAEFNSVTPNYFAAMGIDVVRGRGFTDADREDAVDVAVISETFARVHFDERDPIGARISASYPPRFLEVVGVVKDVKTQGLDQDAALQIYAPFAQRPTGRLTVVMHAGGANLAGVLPSVLRELDPDLAVSQLRAIDDVVAESVWRLRLMTRLFWAFGAFAVLLAAVGIAGIVAHAVASRTREIGLRIALGAPSGSIMRLVGRRIGLILLAGLVTGAVGAWITGRWVAGTLYGVDPRDPVVFVVVMAGFGLVGMVAAWLPARRAVAIDPARALRGD